jgi:hypothetical protein
MTIPLPRCTKPTDPDRAAVPSHRVGDASLETAAPHGEPVDVLRGSRYAAEIERHGTAAQHERARTTAVHSHRVDDGSLETAATTERTFPRVSLSTVVPGSLVEIASGDIGIAIRFDGGNLRPIAWITTGHVGTMPASATVSLRATPTELDALTSADGASRPTLTEEQARRGWFLAAAWARLAQARGGAMQAFDEDYEKTKNARGWLESIGVDVNANPPVVIPEALRASRGETGEPAKAPPVRHPHHDRHCMIYDGVGCSHEAGCEVEK